MNGHLFLCSNAYTKTRSGLLYFIQHIHNCHFNIKLTWKFLMRYFCIRVVFEIGCVSLTAHFSSNWPHFKCSVATGVMSDRQQRCWTHIFCLWTCQPHSGLWALCTHFTWRVLSLTHHLHTSLATSCLFRSQLEITSSRKPPLPPHLKYSCPLAYYRNEFQSILIIHGSHHWLVLPLIKA